MRQNKWAACMYHSLEHHGIYQLSKQVPLFPHPIYLSDLRKINEKISLFFTLYSTIIFFLNNWFAVTQLLKTNDLKANEIIGKFHRTYFCTQRVIKDKYSISEQSHVRNRKVCCFWNFGNASYRGCLLGSTGTAQKISKM